MGDLTRAQKEIIDQKYRHASYRRKTAETVFLLVTLSVIFFFTGYVLGYLHVIDHGNGGVPSWAVKLEKAAEGRQHK